MKSLIFIPILASGLVKACSKTTAKNSDAIVNQGVKNSDAFNSAMTRATAKSAKYLKEDLNEDDSNVYYENGQIVLDNTRK